MTMKEKRAVMRAAREAAEKAVEPAPHVERTSASIDPATRRALMTVAGFGLLCLIVVVIALVGSSRQEQAERECVASGGVIADVHGSGGWICIPSAR